MPGRWGEIVAGVSINNTKSLKFFECGIQMELLDYMNEGEEINSNLC